MRKLRRNGRCFCPEKLEVRRQQRKGRWSNDAYADASSHAHTDDDVDRDLRRVDRQWS
jgi:hypothetical protein